MLHVLRVEGEVGAQHGGRHGGGRGVREVRGGGHRQGWGESWGQQTSRAG